MSNYLMIGSWSGPQKVPVDIVAETAEEYVAGLNIAMNQSRVVRLFERFDRLPEERDDSARGLSAVALHQGLGVEALRQLRTNIFALLGNSSLFDDGKMRNGTGI